MPSTTGQLALRILYTFNGSPQYILAKSSSVVPVEFISSISSGASQGLQYASASLKTCLNMICRTSPEIIQDRTRDYSVYLLDPLESDGAPASSDPKLDTRVAVGMGLMSWALRADETDAMTATGTVKPSPAGQKTLEIVFSLRQTVPIEKASIPQTLRSWSSSKLSSKQKGKQPAQPPLRRTRTPQVSVHRPPQVPAAFEADKLLAVGEHYTGPERRASGRPHKTDIDFPPSTASPSEAITPSSPPPSSSHLDQSNNQLVNNPSALIDILALLQAISPDMVRNKALGNALGLVHGSEGTAAQPQPELAEALKVLAELQQRTPASQPAQSQTHTESMSSSQHRRKSSSTDDEIVILNKENVNPTQFRRRSERDKEDTKLAGSAESSQAASPAQTQSEASTLMPFNSNQLPVRKRTLSQFMNEQDPARESDKEQMQKRYYRQPERSSSMDSSALSADAAIGRSGFRRTISCDPSSSGKNSSHFRSKESPAPASDNHPCTSKSTQLVFLSASSPPRPPPPRLSPRRPPPPRQKYVVPVWARTETATQPRLSNRAIQRMELKEREKLEEEAKKRTQRRTQTKDKERVKERSVRSELPRGSSGSKAPALPAPVAALASSAFPVFAAVIPSASSVPRPRSPTTLPNNRPPPCTPPRSRRAHTVTPGCPSSLFTPATDSWGVSAGGRRSMSPSARKAIPHSEDQEAAQRTEERSDSEGDLLGQELDSAFDEFDFPPSTSTLPGASNDFGREYDSDGSDANPPSPKQHWEGLPPSSPPPPSSSPFLTATPLDDDDVEESPLLTSDADVDVGSELETDAEVPDYSVEELSKLIDVDDLATFFQPSPTVDGAGLFDQFTNFDGVGLSSDDAAQTMKDWGLDVNFEPGPNPDFDFTEFWESVKPLVESSSNADLGQFDQPDDLQIDNTKLAGDVHALFSGCLV